MTRRKQITMTVTVSAPVWLTAAQARKEVRTLINQQTFWGHRDPTGEVWEIGESNFRAAKVSAA